MLARLDALDQENEELKEQVGELEDQKEQMEEQLEQAREKRDRQEDTVKEEKVCGIVILHLEGRCKISPSLSIRSCMVTQLVDFDYF